MFEKIKKNINMKNKMKYDYKVFYKRKNGESKENRVVYKGSYVDCVDFYINNRDKYIEKKKPLVVEKY